MVAIRVVEIRTEFLLVGLNRYISQVTINPASYQYIFIYSKFLFMCGEKSPSIQGGAMGVACS